MGGMAKAKEMMFLAEWFSAEDAKNLGLVNRLVSLEELMPEAIRMAEKLCHFHPQALRFSKKILNRHLRQSLDATLAAEQENIIQSLKATGGIAKIGTWMKERKE